MANKFEGKDRVLQRMAKIPVQVRAVARKQLDEQAAFLVDQIRPAIPFDHGNLAASLEWHRNPRQDKIGVIVTEGSHQENDPQNRKARAVEFGRPDMNAKPHFFPVYRANKKKMRSRVMAAVKRTVEGIWGAGGGGAAT